MTDSIPVTVTYMEQKSRPAVNSAARPAGRVALLRATQPAVHFYRYLYQTIGEPYNWVSRSIMTNEDLVAIIHHPKVHIYILYINGAPGGFAEIDARHQLCPEIKFFGLMPEFIGKGYGRYFLSHVIDLAWTLTSDTAAPQTSPTQNTHHDHNGPDRVLIETCSLDHPAAISLYQKFGFSVIDRRRGTVPKLETLTT